MELLAVVLLFIIFFILLSFKSSVNDSLTKLENEVNDLRKLLASNIKENKTVQPTENVQIPTEPIIPKKDYWESNFKVVDKPATEVPSISDETPVAPKKDTAPSGKRFEQEKTKTARPIEVQEVITPPGKQSEPVPELSFFEKHPDLEKFIGENLVSKVGIAILVLAIGFFVKYAIDKNWIGPVARVGIGILCGGILIALAHRLHKNYKGFSSVLVGGGLAIFYFTIALAYHQFHLFSQTVSFVIMLVITIFAVLLSMLYDRQELAVISLVGGFATPLLVSDGSGNFVTLFSYLLILNTGLLVIAYNKSWRILNTVAFGFTTVLFLTWLLQLPPGTPNRTYFLAFLFETAFYVLFFVINIANNVKENRRFIVSDFSILMANTALYFSAGLYFINMMGADKYRGLFTALLGAFNLVASWTLLRKQSVDRNILYLLIGITVSFISLAAPVQLKGNNITLFWASEAVLLYWLYTRSAISIIRLGSFAVWIAMLGSLLIDLGQLHFGARQAYTVIFNKGFITTTYCALSTFLLFILTRKRSLAANTSGEISIMPNSFLCLSIVLLYAAGALEIKYQFAYYFPGSFLLLQYLLLYTYLYILVVFFVTNRKGPVKSATQPSYYLMLACLVLYVFSISPNFNFLHQVLIENQYHAHLLAHWLAAVVLGIIYFFIVKSTRALAKDPDNLSAATWLLAIWIVVFLSSEINMAAQSIYYNGPDSVRAINQSFIKSGLPILWGFCSFAFMWLGMKFKYRPLRIISLVLFSITLVKLFAFDIRNISAGGKIAAFFCLGVLLLIISFMYQRLKKIIIEDVEKPVI